MTTRGQILEDAYEALALADYVFSLTADERASAFRKLDTMMAQWEGEGIVLGYTPGDGDSAADDVMTTPAYADDAIAYNLALRLAPSFGKVVSGPAKRAARRGYDLVQARTMYVPGMARSRLPIRGAGNWRRGIVDDATVVYDDAVVIYDPF